jgi:hypothetical protein
VFCTDGRDDDCNGIYDCEDMSCAGSPECGVVSCAVGVLSGFGMRIATGDTRGQPNMRNGTCSDGDAGEVYYMWSPPGPGRYIIDTNGSRYDTVLYLLQFACEGPELGGMCNDDIDPGRIQASQLIYDSPDGRPIAIVVDGWDGDEGFYVLNIRRAPTGVDAGVDGGVADAGTDGGVIIVDGGGGCTRYEQGVAGCTNGRDDDCDGRRDCSDPDCRPFGPEGECCNGIDDNGDMIADEFTCRCFTDAECAGVGDLEQVCWTDSYNVCGARCNFYGGDAFCSMWFMDTFPRCNAMTGQCTR